MTNPEVPLGLDRRALAVLLAAMAVAVAATVVTGSARLAPLAAAGVGVGLGGGLLWGHILLRREIAGLLSAWGGRVDEIRLADGGLVARWEVRVDDRTVSLVGTAFGPRNPLFLEDDDGIRRV